MSIIELNPSNIYTTFSEEEQQELKQVYSIGKKVFGELWNSMIFNEEEIAQLQEKISVVNGEVNKKSLAEIIYVLQFQLPEEFRIIPGTSCFLDAGSGYGLSLCHTICQTKKKTPFLKYAGIEIERGRFNQSCLFAKKLNYLNKEKEEKDNNKIVLPLTLLCDSFNNYEKNPELKSILLQSTHWYSFDWVFTQDTHERLAQFLNTYCSTWKVLVSFHSPIYWKKRGLHEKVECFGKLPGRKMKKQNMTAYFYLNKILI